MGKEAKVIEWHTPRAHVKHGGKPCGCYTGEGEKIVCPLCSAACVWKEVVEFPIWRCYDCGARWSFSQIVREWEFVVKDNVIYGDQQNGG